MELLGKKIIKIQDAKFKVHNNKNNETSIFIDKDLASKINLIDGSDSTFEVINKLKNNWVVVTKKLNEYEYQGNL